MLNRAKERNFTFKDQEEERKFTNQLVNQKSLSEWIKCAFNGNVLELKQLTESRQRNRINQTIQFDSLCSNRGEIMRRIHKINYSKIFGSNF